MPAIKKLIKYQNNLKPIKFQKYGARFISIASKKPLTRFPQERAHFVHENQGLVYKFARSFNYRAKMLGLDYEDVVQAGYFGLMKAARSYDESRQSKSTYFSKLIINSINWFLQDAEAQRAPRGSNIISMQDFVKTKQAEKELEFQDLIPDTREGPEERSVRKIDDELIVKAVKNTLTPKEFEIIKLRFGLEGKKEHTLEEIAKILGIKRQKVWMFERRVIRKLRENPLLNQIMQSEKR